MADRLAAKVAGYLVETTAAMMADMKADLRAELRVEC